MAEIEAKVKLVIDPSLTVGDLIDFEEAKSVGGMVDWLVAHAGADKQELRSLRVAELKDLGKAIQEALESLPK